MATTRHATARRRRWEPPLLWGGLTWPIWVALGVATRHPMLGVAVVVGWWSAIFMIARPYYRRWPAGDMGLHLAWLWIICSFVVGGFLMAVLW